MIDFIKSVFRFFFKEDVVLKYRSIFLNYYTGMDVSGTVQIDILTDNFFGSNQVTWLNELFLWSKLGGGISAYRLLSHSKSGNIETIMGGNIKHVFKYEVEITNFEKFLYHMDDGNFKGFVIESTIDGLL